jgi:hypothetical protein
MTEQRGGEMTDSSDLNALAERCEKEAVISACGNYRYRLDRVVSNSGPTYAFVGVNPSTADASNDDATVRKWRGFVSRWGGKHFIVGNVFAYRATNVAELARAADPIGPENFAHLLKIGFEADIIVPCWGSRGKIPKQMRSKFDWAMDVIEGFGKPVRILGLSKSGDPLHPLMLGYDTPLIEWDRSALRARAATEL